VEKLEEGVTVHEAHAGRVILLTQLRYLAWLLLIFAVCLLAFLLVQQLGH